MLPVSFFLSSSGSSIFLLYVSVFSAQFLVGFLFVGLHLHSFRQLLVLEDLLAFFRVTDFDNLNLFKLVSR